MISVPHWLKSLSGGLLSALEKEAIPDPGTPRRVAEQFGQWAAHLSKNAAAHWAPYLLRSNQCEFCDEDALGDCVACQGPCCLGHSHVSHRGELVCDECIGKLLGQSKKKGKVEQAFEFFNMTSGASLDEVTAVYRIRSKQEHPDAGGDNMSKLNQYYHLLKDHLQKKKKRAAA